MLQKSLEAANHLQNNFEIDVEVIDLQSLRPLDTKKIIESVKKTNRLVTVEESWPFGSIGSEISHIVQGEVFDHLDSPVIKVNSADVPMPYSSFLENLYLPQTDDIVNAVKEVCYIQKWLWLKPFTTLIEEISCWISTKLNILFPYKLAEMIQKLCQRLHLLQSPGDMTKSI